MNHEHKVEFPQFEQIKKHAQENQKFYFGVAAGFVLGYLLKGQSCETKLVRVYTMSS
jgi:hypothetical protein